MKENTQNTALLVMDMQGGIYGALPPGASATLISNIAKAIEKARIQKIPVIYVTVGFRTGLPEISANNKSFFAGRERFASVNMEEFTRILPELAPQKGDVIVMKRRFSAFTGSVLRWF